MNLNTDLFRDGEEWAEAFPSFPGVPSNEIIQNKECGDEQKEVGDTRVNSIRQQQHPMLPPLSPEAESPPPSSRSRSRAAVASSPLHSPPTSSFSLASVRVADLASFRVNLLHLHQLGSCARRALLVDMGAAAAEAAEREEEQAAGQREHEAAEVEGLEGGEIRNSRGKENEKKVEEGEKEKEKEAMAAAGSFFAQGFKEPEWILQSKARASAAREAEGRAASDKLFLGLHGKFPERAGRVRALADGFAKRNTAFSASQASEMRVHLEAAEERSKERAAQQLKALKRHQQQKQKQQRKQNQARNASSSRTQGKAPFL